MSEIEINKYQNGKIYKIWNDVNDEIYVGSTHDTLSRRMTKHRATVKTNTSRRLYQTMNEIGIEHFRIELVENFSCKSKEELNAREGHWIRQIGTLNSVIAGRTKKEYYNEHKTIILEHQQQHYEQNKEIVQERQKKYRESHTEEISLQKKAYYEENKAKINEYKKNWYEQNKEAVIARVKANSEGKQEQKHEYDKQRYEEKKEALSVKVDCPCGGCFKVMSKSNHLRTKLHKNYEESKE